MLLVWYVARASGKFAMETLLLAGFAIGTMLNAVTIVFELREEASNSGLRVLAAWLHGQLSIPTWSQLGLIAPLVLFGTLLALPVASRLNTLALGEDYAAQLGVNVAQVRVVTVILGSLLTAAAVSLGGLIGFVGLLVHTFSHPARPQPCPLITGSGYWRRNFSGIGGYVRAHRVRSHGNSSGCVHCISRWTCVSLPPQSSFAKVR